MRAIPDYLGIFPQCPAGLEAKECDKKSGDVVSCAKYIYENVKLVGTLGPDFSRSGEIIRQRWILIPKNADVSLLLQIARKPGQVYSYNSNHLQLAAAVAVSSSKLSIQQVSWCQIGP